MTFHNALVTAAKAQIMDEDATHWGLNHFALVEAAGRACAEVFSRTCMGEKKEQFSVAALAGKGNNAADALVMLKTLILNGYVKVSACSVFAVQIPSCRENAPEGEKTPLSEAVLALKMMGVPVTEWNVEKAAAALEGADLIIDGITGTGLSGPLRGVALEMAETVNALCDTDGHRRFVAAIDMPSGNFEKWQPGMPIIAAHATLAIEPLKLCLYAPAARPYAGRILPVGGIFPPALIGKYREAELIGWEAASARIAPVPGAAYKYERGLVEIRAGSTGAAGAARLSALGAQAAGAGLVRLIVDSSIYPVVAPGCSGVMAVPDGEAAEQGRFSPAAILVGPGWGRGDDRRHLLENYLPLEEQGIPLILDADAIILAKNIVFHGNALLTPHPGEFAAYTGLSKDAILSDPIPVLRRFSAEKKAHILFKSHVLYAVSPDGRIGIIDGMNPVLATGGSGDVLAGFCAAIAARWRVTPCEPFDGYVCACAAASLLIQAAEAEGIAGTFADPAALATAAAAIAGKAWLPGGGSGGGKK